MPGTTGVDKKAEKFLEDDGHGQILKVDGTGHEAARELPCRPGACPEEDFTPEEWEEKMSRLQAVIDEHGRKEGTLIKVLHEAQQIFGYLPRRVLMFIAERMGVNLSEVYGVVSFYSLFTTKPSGKYTIQVCKGTACYVNGAQDVIDEFRRELGIGVGETTRDKLFTLQISRCMGACSVAPVIMIGEDVKSGVTSDKVGAILAEYRPKRLPDATRRAEKMVGEHPEEKEVGERWHPAPGPS